eukprot:3949727-Amphidinium_carterae.2
MLGFPCHGFCGPEQESEEARDELVADTEVKDDNAPAKVMDDSLECAPHMAEPSDDCVPDKMECVQPLAEISEMKDVCALAELTDNSIVCAPREVSEMKDVCALAEPTDDSIVCAPHVSTPEAVEFSDACAPAEMKDDHALVQLTEVCSTGADETVADTGVIAHASGAHTADAHSDESEPVSAIQMESKAVSPPRRDQKPRDTTLWYMAERLLRGMSSSLGRFLATARALSSAGQLFDPSTCNTPLKLDDLFPCGFPYPAAYLDAAPPTSSRRRARWTRQREWQRRVNMTVGVHTWLALGRPRSERLASVMCLPLSSSQWELVARIESCMLEFDRLSGAASPGSGGLNTSLAEKLITLADSRHDYLGVRADVASDMEGAPTVCLDSSNASLPKIAARICLEPPVLPGPVARLLHSEQGFSREMEDMPESLPRRHLNISAGASS